MTNEIFKAERSTKNGVFGQTLANAVEIQIEEGFGNSEAVIYLIKALYAVASTYEKARESKIAAVIKKMESLVSTMKT